ncbi:cytochrome P450, partial [Nocardia africana]
MPASGPEAGAGGCAVAATLVLGYYTAVRILHDPEHFPADPRPWQQSV